ncbi:cytochrome P450 family protein [Antrihabitans cavernicola]|uniref:Cytochrome P450 n=1 Tax=Antrihabitans cavernicola TaxID=2495913 RepID=A0A5A7SH06_9NOCA|nr:cytochrome P450 [Spelaeibacter cavernicola]KAA0024432.1 cytochrome P450 [Spelaeibacter cavernicola]
MATETIIELGTDFYRDPHEFYRRVRSDGGVHKVRLENGVVGWLITDYALAKQVLVDPTVRKDAYSDTGVAARIVAGQTDAGQILNRHITEHMLNSDPPKHTRLRSLVNKAFTSRAVRALEPRIVEIADRLLDDMERHDSVDLLDSYAFPLPITVICELLGVPVADRDDFRDWSNAVVSVGRPADMRDASDHLDRYLTGLIEGRTAAPGDDLLSELIAATENGDRLTADELVSMAFLLLVAGHETTVNLIGNTMIALLDNPADLSALREDPERIPAFIEESLRHEGPVHIATLRYTTESITVGDTEIGGREMILVSLSGANRDPKRFDDPEELDPTRLRNSHLAFGYGIHHCVGAPLARLEGRIALERLIARFPDIALDAAADDLEWRHSLLIRGLTSLPVKLAR